MNVNNKIITKIYIANNKNGVEIVAKKQKKTTKELMREAREEGLFKEAEEMARTKKKYKFNSTWDGLITILLFIVALVIITLVRRFFNL